MPDEMLILTLGQPMGVDQVPTLPGFAAGGKAETTAGVAEVVVARVESQDDQIPGRWYGFDAAHAIVIDTGDRASLQALDGLKGQALVDWVRHGGHLVVSVGANWQAVRDSVLGPILPAQPAGQERVPSLEAIDTFAGSTKPITPVGTPAVMVTRLEGADERGGKPLSVVGDLPLVVRGAQGFGRVTLIAMDVDQKIFADWADRGLFWARALDLRHDRPDQTGGGARLGGTGRFYQTGVSDLSSQLRIGLEQFPGVKLIPFGWVAFFIFLYILLIGPGDYLFLKKVLKRMELTWITFPTIVVTVSLLAYFAAYRLKGNDLLVNKVDVIDVDQAGGLVRGRTILSLFSPQNRDYNVGFVPVPPTLDHDVSPLASPSSSGESAPSAGRYRARDDLVQRARAPVRRHGGGQPALQLLRRRLLVPANRWARAAGEPADPDLEHQGRDRALVRAGWPARGCRPSTRRYRPPVRHGHQPPELPARGRDPCLWQAGLHSGRHRPRSDDPGGAVRRPQPLRPPQRQGGRLSLRPARESEHEDQPSRSPAGRNVPRQRVVTRCGPVPGQLDAARP